MSKIVPEIITGSRVPVSSKNLSIANRHAFMTSVSNDVSGQQDVDPAGHQGPDLLEVAGDHLVEGRVAPAGIVDMDAHRELLLGRADAAGDEPGLVRVFAGKLIRHPPRQLGRRLVQLEYVFLKPKLLERDRRAIECVGLDDVGAGFEVGAMDALR